MKRIQYRRYGGPGEMRLEAFELPSPGKNEIVVRVEAASVNPFDWKVRQGAMKFMVRAPFPRAMGTDFSGVVESVGAGVTRFHAGDEVLGTAPSAPAGAFAEKLITEEKLVVAKPATLSFEEAAALPVVGVTAGGLSSCKAVCSRDSACSSTAPRAGWSRLRSPSPKPRAPGWPGGSGRTLWPRPRRWASIGLSTTPRIYRPI